MMLLRKIGLICILTLILETGINAQLTWTQQNSSFGTSAIKDIFFLDVNNGWGVGENGKIIQTVDGGANWFVVTSPVTVTLHAIWFSSNTTGWIVGDNETLLKSVDGGNTWAVNSPPSGTSSHLYDIQFTDAEHGWIIGFLDNFYTTDGGNTWVDFDPTGVSNTVLDLHFISNTEGFISGYAGALYHTTDGGDNWTLVPTLWGSDIYCLYVFDSSTILIAGSGGYIHKTTDGGNNWNIVVSSMGYALLDMDFQDANLGVTVGNGASAMVTLDGGETWYLDNFATCDFTSVQMIEGGIGYTAGYCGNIYKSSYGENDVTIDAYLGIDTLCKNVETDVYIEIFNEGPAPIDAVDFVLMDDASDILGIYQWTGYLLAGETESVNLGTVTIDHSGYYQCVFSGDSVDANNIYTKFIQVILPPGTVSGSQEICAGDSVTISVDGDVSVTWLFDCKDSSLADQVVKPTEDTYYSVFMKSVFCEQTDSVQIIVNDCSEVVTAISPNGDGVNDYLDLGNIPVMENFVKIYNRWGDLVNSFTNYDNINVRWEGTRYDGETLVEGTYYYVFQTADNSVNYSSWVQIVR
ncbi:MAG: gliding motility-associated C-terminal domain-containing protein [Crocinitomicaceae bacterium]|nr:gliding motility-associated C-terminal domain-containing protein [Crocinitomicaceae bacterium]